MSNRVWPQESKADRMERIRQETEPPPRAVRRLIIRDTNGEMLAADNYGRPLQHYQIDLTAVANANVQALMMGVVQEQCNLGCWHDKDMIELMPWGAD